MRSKQNLRFFSLSLTLITFFAVNSISAQTRPGRSVKAAAAVAVVVVLKDGQRISAEFVSANSAFVTVKLASTAQVIALKDIAELVFDEGAQKKNQTADASNIAAKNALVALQGLESATSVGVNVSEYSTRLINAKVVLDQSLPTITSEDIKRALNMALADYSLASQAWQETNRVAIEDRYNSGWIDSASEFGQSLLAAYKIQTEELPASHRKVLLKFRILSAIWESASGHIKEASALINPTGK